MIDTKLIAITGYKYSGKSTISNIFKSLGFTVVGMAPIYEALLKAGTPIHKQLLYHFGEDILSITGDIDIVKLGLLTCKDKWIADVVDDVVSEQMISFVDFLKDMLEGKSSMVFLDFSFVVDNNVLPFVDSVLFVESNEVNRKNRLEKLLTDDVVSKIIQLERQVDLPGYDIKIDNNEAVTSLVTKCSLAVDKLSI